MWCKNCRQDVPGMATAALGQFCCPRCSQVLVGTAEGISAESGSSQPDFGAHGISLEAPPRPAEPPLDPDDFDWDQNIKSLQALAAEIAPALATRHRESAFGPRHEPGARHGPLMASPQPIATIRPRHSATRRSIGSILTWLVIWSSVTAFVAGGVMMAWSLRMDRGERWTEGLIFAGTGLAGLLIGILLQLERVWIASRYTLDRLDDLDVRLGQMEEAAALSAIRHSTPAQAFYGHYAEGAAPHVLLADLKGQLDLLALKLSSRRAA